VIDILLYFNMADIFKICISVSAPLKPIEWATFNQIGKVQLAVRRTYFLFTAPIIIEDFPNHVG
jgi:hypothetical protein